MVDDENPQILTTADANRRVTAAVQSTDVVVGMEFLGDVSRSGGDPESRSTHVQVKVKGTGAAEILANLATVGAAIDATPGVQLTNAKRDGESPECVLSVMYHAKNTRRP